MYLEYWQIILLMLFSGAIINLMIAFLTLPIALISPLLKRNPKLKKEEKRAKEYAIYKQFGGK